MRLKTYHNSFDRRIYPGWLAAPGLLIYALIFVIPTFSSFYFSLTKWNLITSQFIGIDNFVTFFSMINTKSALINTVIYAFFTCTVKVVFGLPLAQYLCTGIKSKEYLKTILFLPTLLGNVAVAVAFESILAKDGLVNQCLINMGFAEIKWLTDPKFALFSCILVDIWKGMGVAIVIYVAGLSAISRDYYEAAMIDGASVKQSFFRITLPLMVPTVNSVLTLSLIGGLRNYELVYSLTGGGPGYSTELLGSAIYKLFSRGSYGLATSGYVIMFVVVSIIVFPLHSFVSRREAEL